MDFCNKCGAPLISLNNVLVCKRCNEEEYLNQLQIIEDIESLKRQEKEDIESLKRKEKEEIESLKRKEKEHIDFLKRKEKDLTFPYANDVLVFRLKQPEVYIKKQRKGKLGPNFTTAPFYKFLHKLIEQYSPIDFKYIPGNPWSRGNVSHKYGILLIKNKLVYGIKKTVEEFILSDGEHYTLEELNKSIVDKRKLIKSLSDEMKIIWDKKALGYIKYESKKKNTKRKDYLV